MNTRISVQPEIEILGKDHCGDSCRFLATGGKCILFKRDLDLVAGTKVWQRCRRCKMAENKCTRIFGNSICHGMLSERLWMQKC